jgi:hypothetical protein
LPDPHRGDVAALKGELADGRAHFDQALALYDPDAHRRLATRFGEDQNVPGLVFRAWAAWLLGFPEAALCDANDALKSARATGQAGTLMFALRYTADPLIHCGHYSRAGAHLQELGALAEKKAARFWTIQPNFGPRFPVCSDWRAVERSGDDYLWDRGTAGNWLYPLDTLVVITFGCCAR